MVINPIVGVYIPIIRILIKSGMTIPNIATFDHGTYEKFNRVYFGGISKKQQTDEDILKVWPGKGRQFLHGHLDV